MPRASLFPRPRPFPMQLLNKAEKREAALPPDRVQQLQMQGEGSRVPQLSLPNTAM